MEPIGRNVDRELARFGPAAGMRQVVGAWAAAVGETVARNAWPARLARDGTLHVSTSSSAWAFELAQLAPTVLERLREALGEEAPAAIRFAPGRLPEAGPAPAREGVKTRPEPTAQELAAAEAFAAEIADEDLRTLVARAAAASLSRAAASRPV
jgi:predicted nucleic acid-binding Zn ribbon protein